MYFTNPLDYLPNPLIEKKGKHVLVGGVPSTEITFQFLEPNMLNVGPWGHVAEFFGYYRTMHLLYLFATEEDRAAMGEGIKAGTIVPPIFPLRRGIAGPGTLEIFLKTKSAKKVIAAVQYYTYEGDLFVTHMVVRSKWRRARLNTLLINAIIDDTKPVNIWWDDPTREGEKFMAGYGVGLDAKHRPRV
jgi:hypothetical protein